MCCNYIWDYDVITGEPVKLYIFEQDEPDREPDEPAPELPF